MEQAAAEEHKDSVMRLQQELHDMRHLWLEAKKQVGNPCCACTPAVIIIQARPPLSSAGACAAYACDDCPCTILYRKDCSPTPLVSEPLPS